ncbi:MAG TPA: hypothetical protein VJ226_01340, partial [Bradyrhizobium sp.]|nr:hypothetical protein [Bradyrhizobium sp.]
MPATQAVLDVIFPTYSPLLLSLGIRDRQTLGSIQAKAPIFLALALEPLRAAKAETLADQAQRISRMGRDNLGIVNGQNFGHSVRQTAIYSHNGELLRAADVEIVDAGDVRNPNSILRRARRTDPLETLMRVGTINGRDYEAGEILRQDLERQGAKLPAGTMPARPSPPWNRVGVNDAQREAMFAVREALDA